MSARRSSSLMLAAAVRTMKPPRPFSRSLVTMRFSRWRSSSELILRDTPTWFTVGMYTRKRPGSAMWLVMRAPFLPIGSLAIWTRTSWPSFNRSVISGCGRFECGRGRTLLRRPLRRPRCPRCRSYPGRSALALLIGQRSERGSP